MKIIINRPDAVSGGSQSILEPISVSMDPERRYAVVETRPSDFTALTVTSLDDELLIGDYVDHYSWSTDVPMLYSFIVSWDCIRFGFCKLILWAPELSNKNGGDFFQTARRFYFDRELYRASREALHGVPGEARSPEDEPEIADEWQLSKY